MFWVVYKGEKEQQIEQVFIEIDWQHPVLAVYKGEKDFTEFGSLVQQIKLRLDLSPNYVICFVTC